MKELEELQVRDTSERGRIWTELWTVGTGTAVVDVSAFTLTRDGEPEEHYGVRINPEYLPTLLHSTQMHNALLALTAEPGWAARLPYPESQGLVGDILDVLGKIKAAQELQEGAKVKTTL